MSGGITLNNQNFVFTESYLPCLVNGIDGSGASNFSIELAAEFIRNQSKLIFFTAYPMAKDKLMDLVDTNYLHEINSEKDITNASSGKALVVKSGDLDLLNKVLESISNIQEYIIFIKNIEKYKALSSVIWENSDKLLLSGSVDDCLYKERVLQIDWCSKVIFSPSSNFPVDSIPTLEKYESYLISPKSKGILRLT